MPPLPRFGHAPSTIFLLRLAPRRLLFRTSTSSPEEGRRLDEAGPLACRLRSRAVVRFRGPDTVKFLQGLLTNDVRPLAASGCGYGNGGGSPTTYLPTPNLNHRSPQPVYAALLTPEGRFLYDLFLYRPPRAEEKLDKETGSGPGKGTGCSAQEEPFSLLADVDATVVDELLASFKKHRLRSKVDLDNLTEEYSCWQWFGSTLSCSSSQEPEAASIGWGRGVDHVGEATAQGNDLGWRWFKDPRLHSLGFRGIFPSKSIPPLVEADKEVVEHHYLLWRIHKGVAEGSIEIPKGEAIPLEYNLAGLNAISFDKGCYIGQELVARTHHRGVIRKRLLPLKFVNDNGEDLENVVAPSSTIVSCITNKKMGTMNTAIGSRGMGVVRLEEAFKQPPTLSIKDHDEVKVEVIKPDWWPAEWTQSLGDQNVSA